MHSLRRRAFVIALFIGCSPAALQAAERPRFPDRPVDEAYIKELAQKVEPDSAGKADRLSHYVDFFRLAAANDNRLFAFNVKAEAEGEHGVRLHGVVEFPETRNALVAFFHALQFDPVENQIETLPSAKLGKAQYGIVKVANSLSYADASDEEVVTDCLLGEPVFLLQQAENGYFWVHGGDGYLGFVAERDIERVDEDQFAAYLDGPRACVRTDHKLDAGQLLPAGSRLKWIATEGNAIKAKLPTGETVDIPADKCDVRDAPKEKIDLVCKNAQQLLGTKYLWGGKTSSGVDCSGLVQVSFAGAGVTVPRDANQQFHVGQLTATRWSRQGMRRGDTLYFINPQGRISHTGLYLGDDQFVHAVSPVVIINSFNPKDENYAPRQDQSFAFARRLWE